MIHLAGREPPETPTGAARPDAERLEPPICPFCGSTRSEQIALIGSQMLTDQRRCSDCHSYYEAVREDR